MMRILVIEDEPEVARQIVQGLEAACFDVEATADGNEALELARSRQYHLILLDAGLPERDGWSICAALRAQRNTVPILMLTATNAASERVRSLDMGADDCLCKPFAMPELQARVRALVRRDKMHYTRSLRIGDLEIDSTTRCVTRAGKEIELSHREYDLLEALAVRAGQVLTREFIQERIWRNDHAGCNTVNVYVGMLRRKIDAANTVKLIYTVHGVGYMLRLPEESQ